MTARQKELLRSTLRWAAWSTLVPLVGLAAARLLGFADRSATFFAIDTLTPALYLPAYAAGVTGVLVRRRGLAGTAAVLVVLHLVWVAPDMRWWAHDQPAAAGTPVEVVAANALVGNQETGQVVRRLRATHADVLVVVELNTAVARALRAEYPHAVVHAQDRTAFGAGVFSRLPLSELPPVAQGGAPAIRVSVDLHGIPTTLVAVHTLQPLRGHALLHRQMAELAALARDEPGPLLLLGDFNATRQHRPFRDLLATGLRDAHLERGQGLARSWPVSERIPPLALLDHVLVSEHFAVEAAGTFTVPGSDHRGVRATLRPSEVEEDGRR